MSQARSEKPVSGTTEAWEQGSLGEDEKYARLSTAVSGADVDDALGLQMISIRLDKGLLEMLKLIASINGIGYQPLIRKLLHRAVDAEAKVLLAQYNRELEEAEGEAEQRERAVG